VQHGVIDQLTRWISWEVPEAVENVQGTGERARSWAAKVGRSREVARLLHRPGRAGRKTLPTGGHHIARGSPKIERGLARKAR